MKKFILSVICLSIVSSAACAIPPTLRAVLLEAKEGAKFMVRRSMSTVKSLPGYTPKDQSDLTVVESRMPTRIKLLGPESYVPLDTKQFHARELDKPVVTKDSHSILVELKKK